MMPLTPQYEAVFAAAAHYLTAIRFYSDAIAVLECCRVLHGDPDYSVTTARQLEAVQKLVTQLFTGWPKAYVPPAAELAELRRALRNLRRLLLPKLKRGRRTKTIYDFLRHVERRPALHLGKISIERLKFLIQQTLWPLTVKLDEGDPPFGSFPTWINRRYSKLQGGGHSWDDILLRAAGSDEDAVKLFFKELRHFRRSEKGA